MSPMQVARLEAAIKESKAATDKVQKDYNTLSEKVGWHRAFSEVSYMAAKWETVRASYGDSFLCLLLLSAAVVS